MFRMKPGRPKFLRSPITVVPFCAAVTASGLLNPIGVHAQAETGSLSAAIEEVRQSPFWNAQSAVPPVIDVPRALWLPVAILAQERSNQAAPNDSTFPHGRVFFAALGANGLMLFPTLYFGISGAYSSDPGPYLLAATALPVLGTAAGAKLAGARFLPALVGSAMGFAAAATTLYVAAVADAPGAGALWIVLPVMQAGITTLVASYSHQKR